MSEEWKVVPGYYPGFLEIIGASFKVSVVTDAIDLKLEDHIARVRDAHIMAAGKDLLGALEGMTERLDPYDYPDEQRKAKLAIAKARGQA